MNINLLNCHHLKNIKANQQYKNNSINFKSNKPDTFEKSTECTYDKYQERLKTKPEAAFLYDDSLSHEQKLRILKNHPTLCRSQDISRETGFVVNDWFNDECFVIEDYLVKKNSRSTGDIKTRVFDRTNELNKENIERLKSVSDETLSTHSFRIKYSIDKPIYERYIKKGYLTRVKLKSIENKELPTNLIDPKNETNQKGLERLKNLSMVRGEINKELVKLKKEPVNVNVLKLQQLGFGTPLELATLISKGVLEGEVKQVKTSNGTKKIATVNVNNKKNEAILKQLRERNHVTLQDCKIMNDLSTDAIEDSILSGDLKVIREKVFICDNEIYVNISDKNNIATLERLKLEKEAQRALEALAKAEEKEKAKNDKSTKMKIVWHLCPNMKHVASILFKQNPEVGEILQRKKELKDLIKEKVQNGEKTEELEEELIELTQKKDEILKKFFKAMWNTTGSAEFSQALSEASQIMQAYAKHGIDAIKDEKIRDIILNVNQD